MPAHKKHASTRRRRNTASTAATLVVPTLADYSGWTATQLRDEIDRRNGDREDDDRLSRSGTKQAMAERLLDDDRGDIPGLPERPQGWAWFSEFWWDAIWSSPMSKEWHPETDYFNVVRALTHFDDWWTAETATERQKADNLFDKAVAKLGLTPYDRRRLEWQIEQAKGAQAQGERLRSQQPPAPPAAPKAGADPRAGLSLVQ
jgi:hypothetical protein